MNAVYEATILQARVFCFHFFHHLFAERADFSWASDNHALVAFEAKK